MSVSERSRGRNVQQNVRKGLGVLASLVKLAGLVIALILVIYIVFVLGKANPANGLTVFIDEWAHKLNLGLDGLFNPGDPRIKVAINYLIPAVIWLIAASIVARLIRRI